MANHIAYSDVFSIEEKATENIDQYVWNKDNDSHSGEEEARHPKRHLFEIKEDDLGSYQIDLQVVCQLCRYVLSVSSNGGELHRKSLKDWLHAMRYVSSRFDTDSGVESREAKQKYNRTFHLASRDQRSLTPQAFISFCESHESEYTVAIENSDLVGLREGYESAGLQHGFENTTESFCHKATVSSGHIGNKTASRLHQESELQRFELPTADRGGRCNRGPQGGVSMTVDKACVNEETVTGIPNQAIIRRIPMPHLRYQLDDQEMATQDAARAILSLRNEHHISENERTRLIPSLHDQEYTPTSNSKLSHKSKDVAHAVPKIIHERSKQVSHCSSDSISLTRTMHQSQMASRKDVQHLNRSSSSRQTGSQDENLGINEAAAYMMRSKGPMEIVKPAQIKRQRSPTVLPICINDTRTPSKRQRVTDHHKTVSGNDCESRKRSDRVIQTLETPLVEVLMFETSRLSKLVEDIMKAVESQRKNSTKGILTASLANAVFLSINPLTKANYSSAIEEWTNYASSRCTTMQGYLEDRTKISRTNVPSSVQNVALGLLDIKYTQSTKHAAGVRHLQQLVEWATYREEMEVYLKDNCSSVNAAHEFLQECLRTLGCQADMPRIGSAPKFSSVLTSFLKSLRRWLDQESDKITTDSTWSNLVTMVARAKMLHAKLGEGMLVLYHGIFNVSLIRCDERLFERILDLLVEQTNVRLLCEILRFHLVEPCARGARTDSSTMGRLRNLTAKDGDKSNFETLLADSQHGRPSRHKLLSAKIGEREIPSKDT